MNHGVLIIGTGPAGVSTAETLRKFGYRERITMLSKEPFPPYSPPLMANYLETRGTSDLIFWKGKDFCKDFDIDCKTSAEVGKVEPKRKRVVLTDGTFLEYNYLVIASGSEMWIPIKCECPAEKGKEKYYNFKSLTAVSKLLNEVDKGADKAVIIGAGFIGMEIAITLRRIGLSVLVVEMMDRILPRMITKDIAVPLESVVQDMGIELLLNHKGDLLKGKETAEELLLSDGTLIKGNLFIAATGIKPNISFLAGSGIQTQKGIRVNAYLKTNYDTIFAGGDVAEVPDLITGNAYPHAIYPEAVKQGKTIAFNILGERVSYEGGLNMNSLYHFNLPMISEGAMIAEEKADEELFYRKENVIRKIGLKDGKILRFELVGDKEGSGLLHTLMTQRKDVSRIKDALVAKKYNQAKHFMNSFGQYFF
ncbi:MAG: NAD(P)/FAD-dependent oxidoreductase [Calditrichaeota bacterium]|nr:NAD(P)/FAD-dependent oxidoreductase [Calditrichota bacterium]